ncbi:TPA: AIPR family protein [Yersinia enterocolitica]
MKLSRLSCNLLDLSFDPDSFRGRYNNIVISKFELFRNVYFKLITRKPILNVKYYYVTKGIEIHPNVEQQIIDLKRDVSLKLTDASVEFYTIGATNLLEIYRKRDNEVFSLKLAENPLSSQGKVFISLVKLPDYYKFITDAEGNIIRRIFEANVRDYQGKTNVNQEIQESLEMNGAREDFWWLNNGVTILASDVSAPGGKELVIHNPEIVNGLQTSNEIYRYFSTQRVQEDSRGILVRVIVPDDEESRDRIIRATNSQTPIPKASLRATDAIHRDIEDFMKPRGLFYDRRKNYYKNEGKKPTEIISLAFLAQCVMSITLQKPDFARARPSTLLEDNSSYSKLYSKTNDVKSYYISGYIGKNVESLLKDKVDVSISDKNNIKFYIVYSVAALVTKNFRPGFRSLSNVSVDDFTQDIYDDAYSMVYSLYNLMGGGDKLSKGRDLMTKLMAEMELTASSETLRL